MIRMAWALQVASYLPGGLFTNDLEEKQEILLPKKIAVFAFAGNNSNNSS